MIQLPNRDSLSKVLFLNDMYQGILGTPGAILHIGSDPLEYCACTWSWLLELYESSSLRLMCTLNIQDWDDESTGILHLHNALISFLDKNPYVTVALAYFDYCAYADTQKCLEMIVPRLVRGSILAFSNIQRTKQYLAVSEVLGFNGLTLQQWHHSRPDCYVVI